MNTQGNIRSGTSFASDLSFFFNKINGVFKQCSNFLPNAENNLTLF